MWISMFNQLLDCFKSMLIPGRITVSEMLARRQSTPPKAPLPKVGHVPPRPIPSREIKLRASNEDLP